MSYCILSASWAWQYCSSEIEPPARHCTSIWTCACMERKTSKIEYIYILYAYVPITVAFCSNRSASLQFDKRVFLLFKESFRGSLDFANQNSLNCLPEFTWFYEYLAKFQRRFESSLFSVVVSCSPECELSQMAPSSQTSTTPSDTKSSRADSKFRISAWGSENSKKRDLSIQMQAFKWVGNFKTKTNPTYDGGCTWRSAVSCLLVSVLLNRILSVTWELRLAHAMNNHDQSWTE